MTTEELNAIVETLDKAFPKLNLSDGAIKTMFRENIKRFSFSAAKQGMEQYILTETEFPTIAGVVNKMQSIQQMINQDIYGFNTASIVSCTKCKGKGFIFHYYDSGREKMQPCDCKRGRAMYPWYFKTDYERNQDREEQIRRGQNPSKDTQLMSKKESDEYFGKEVTWDEYRTLLANKKFTQRWENKEDEKSK